MPASISSKTSVSPPPTAAIASATRDSSPPDAVSATGANGRPRFGRIRNTTSSAPDADGSPPRGSTAPPRPLPFLRRERPRGRGGARRELRHVAQPLALRAQRLLVARLEPLR